MRYRMIADVYNLLWLGIQAGNLSIASKLTIIYNESIMNRQHFAPSNALHYYPTTNPIIEYGYPPSQSRKTQQSDLVIFNGTQPQKSYHFNQKQADSHHINTIARSTSQKTYPIIYNSYNQYRNPTENANTHSNPTNLKETQPKTYKPPNQHLFQQNHSDVYLYNDLHPKNQHSPQNQGYQPHNFKYVPFEPQTHSTAHFLHIPSDHSDSSQHKQSLSTKKVQLVYQQQTNNPHNHASREEATFMINQGMQMSRPATRTFNNVIPSPRVNIQNGRPNSIAVNQQRPRLIQIPQQQYQKYVEHLSVCRGSQEEFNGLRLKNQQLASKERFYLQENGTLREENTRLRDLVAHFEKREKELLRERQDLRSSLLQNINKYQQSSLEEVGLLLERYRLELQKKK